MENNLSECEITLKDASYDSSHKEYMTECDIKVLNFDRIKGHYINKYLSGINPDLKSNDVLCFSKEGLVFIEFKNGCIDAVENNKIILKIYDSLFIFFEVCSELGFSKQIVQNSITYSRKNIEYILVYNKDRYNVQKGKLKDTPQTMKGVERQLEKAGEKIEREKLQHSISRDSILKRYGKIILFGLDRYKGYLFKNVYTLTKEEFNNKFVPRLENQKNEEVI